MIIGSAGSDYAGKKDAGIAAGVLNFSQYIASGLSSFTIGVAVENGGWGLWPFVLLPAAAIGATTAGILHFRGEAMLERHEATKGSKTVPESDFIGIQEIVTEEGADTSKAL